MTEQVQAPTHQLARLINPEWKEVQKAAKARFLTEVMGVRPERKDIDKELPNNNPVTLLERLALVLLIVIGIFTAFKMIALSGDFAAYYFPEAGYEVIKLLFQVASALVFVLASTSGLIYFKLQSEARETLERQAAHPMTRRNFLKIEVFSHRLYPLLTYLVAIWLFVTSAYGTTQDNFLESVFTRYLPVIMEIALASLVADVLRKIDIRKHEVYTVWKLRCEDYDKRVEAMETDKGYLHVLFEEMRDTLIRLKRQGKPVNAWLELANGDIVRKAMVSEYKRLKQAGSDFAEEVVAEPSNVHTVDFSKFGAASAAYVEKLVNDGTRTGRAEPEAYKMELGKRIRPPHNAKRWTVDTLIADFKRRGLKPDQNYSEAMLNADYEAGYGHRTAWRGGAKAYFTAAA